MLVPAPHLPEGGVQLVGNDTFIVATTFTQTSGFFTVGRPLDLSQSINISTFSNNSAPIGQNVEGTDFENVLLQGTLHFAATPYVPAVIDGGVPANNTSFTMTGDLSIFEMAPNGGFGALLRTAALTGSGFALPRVGPGEVYRNLGDGAFGFDFDFFFFFMPPETPSPTPDPSTLLLVSGGLLAVLRKRSRV